MPEMTAGPLKYPVVYATPEGIDMDVHTYFISDKVGLQTHITLAGVQALADPVNMLFEIGKMMKDPHFTKLADDWRLMTWAEVGAYRKGERERKEAEKDVK